MASELEKARAHLANIDEALENAYTNASHSDGSGNTKSNQSLKELLLAREYWSGRIHVLSGGSGRVVPVRVG